MDADKVSGVSGVVLSDRADLRIIRNGDRVSYIPKTEHGEKEVSTALRFLHIFEGYPFVPQLIAETPYLTAEYVEGSPVTDEAKFYRSVASCLETLCAYGVHHGDSTSKNVRVRDNQIVLLDWQEAIYWAEDLPAKRKEPDAFHLWPAAAHLSPDTTRRGRRWSAIRQHLNHIEWQSILDLGCYQGDFAAYAAAENRRAFAVDRQFSAEELTAVWGTLPFQYARREIIQYDFFPVDVTLFMSVFPYIVIEYGWERATTVFKKALANTRWLYFETQLYRDGPGPVRFQSDHDVYGYLSDLAPTERLVTIGVAGRDASRTVWVMKGDLR